MKKNPPKIPIFDIHQSAYLLFKGIVPELQKEGTRVIFYFTNDAETQQAMIAYNSNPAVPILDFVATLRRLRAQMLSLRDGATSGSR